MEIADIESLLIRKKSIVFCTKDRELRLHLMNTLAKALRAQPHYDVYVFPENLKSCDKYLKAATRLLPVVSPNGIPKERMKYDQVSDVQLNWVNEKSRACIFLGEFQKMHKFDPFCFIQTISSYLTCAYEVAAGGGSWDCFRFFISVDALPTGFLSQLELHIGRSRGDQRSSEEIAGEFLEVLKL